MFLREECSLNAYNVYTCKEIGESIKWYRKSL